MARTVRLPDRPPGEYYALRFGDPGRSTLWQVLWQPGALVPLLGTTRYSCSPPDFGSLCVCCNREAQSETLLETGSGAEVRSDPIRVPVCRPCERGGHIGYPRARFLLMALPALVGAMTLVSGICALILGDLRDLGMVLAALSAPLLALWLLAWRLNVARRRALCRGGHWPWLMASIGPNTFTLHTTNRALVERLTADPLFRRLSVNRLG